jgi:1-acyl-sn-glycerol-3-phosphate acyltransferase
MKKPETHLLCRYFKPVSDIIATLLLWTYFSVGFVILFFPSYLAVYLFSENREISFQRLNHKFYKGFFSLARLIVFGHKWLISDDVRSIRSSVIVCNHISYLDPIFFLSLFEKQKTIVKNTFFRVPIFGRVLKASGYIPSASDTNLSDLMLRHIEAMDDYLASGGNFFVFPEGTRSRDGTIGRLNKGAFKIARLCKTSIKVLFIRNTNKLLKPGKFLFNTCVPNTITVELLASIEPDYQSGAFSISELMSEVRSILEAQRSNLVP